MILAKASTAELWLWVIGIWTVPYLISYLVNLYKDGLNKKKWELESQQSCVHGTTGARWKPANCQSCEAERKQKELKAARAAHERRYHESLAAETRIEEWRQQIRLPEYLRQLHPQKFEEIIAYAYERLGYKVKLTPYSGDGGVDAFLEKGGKRWLLQCKRVQGSVGQPILRDLYGSIHHEKADGGIVVTTGRVSEKAKEWIAGKNIEVVELSALQQLLERAFPSGTIVPDSFTVSAIPKDTCPECTRKLVLRKGKRGRFWGCTGYPECRFTRNYR